MTNINQLPYQKINNNKNANEIARFLLKKIKKILKEKSPYHYLIFGQVNKRLKYIQELSKKYKYFLRLDIEKYYPSINHQILIITLERILKSRRGKAMLKTKIIPFLNKIGFQNKGLPLGNYLSYVLAGFHLLPLDIKLIILKIPFLRIQDDYLVFCKNKKELIKILEEIIIPELNKLELKININKLNSGRFHQNPVEFMGFRYYAGIFTISEEKIEDFKKKIIRITHLTKNKPTKAIIKQLNNKILGFSNYYKFASCKQNFEELDAFIRMRLRRYLNRNKDSKNKQGNLLLTNEVLKNMGLKSLTGIYMKYVSKKRLISKKNKKKHNKNGLNNLTNLNLDYGKNIDKSLLLAIFKELKEITKKLDRLNKKVNKINKNKNN